MVPTYLPTVKLKKKLLLLWMSQIYKVKTVTNNENSLRDS